MSITEIGQLIIEYVDKSGEAHEVACKVDYSSENDILHFSHYFGREFQTAIVISYRRLLVAGRLSFETRMR